MNELIVIKDKVDEWTRWTSERVRQVNELIVIKDKVTEEHTTIIIKPYLPPIFKVNMAYYSNQSNFVTN